jgi:hypothetical protein
MRRLVYRMGPAIDDLHPRMSGRIVITNGDRRVWVSYDTRIVITDRLIFMNEPMAVNAFQCPPIIQHEVNQISDLEKVAIVSHGILLFRAYMAVIILGPGAYLGGFPAPLLPDWWLARRGRTCVKFEFPCQSLIYSSTTHGHRCG